VVAASAVVGFGLFYIVAYSTNVPRLRYLGIPVLLLGLWYALRRWWPIALAGLGMAALAEMIARYHAAPRYDLVRVDVGLGFEAAFAAMILFGALLVVNAAVSRRFVPSFILLGYLSAWLMWVQGNERRVLFFYHMLGASLFMAIALAYALAALRGTSFSWRERRIPLSALAYAAVAVVLAAFVFFYPVWTAIPLTNSDFMMRMWVASWQ
jgi:dolichyl-phosphate-mannose--protein O-mannosyl transferase